MLRSIGSGDEKCLCLQSRSNGVLFYVFSKCGMNREEVIAWYVFTLHNMNGIVLILMSAECKGQHNVARTYTRCACTLVHLVNTPKLLLMLMLLLLVCSLRASMKMHLIVVKSSVFRLVLLLVRSIV